MSVQKTEAGPIFEGALVWGLIGLSIALLLSVLAGAIDLLPASTVMLCRSTASCLCAVLTLVALLYTAVDRWNNRVRN